MDKTANEQNYDIRPDVLNADDIIAMAPWFAKHPRLLDKLLHFFWVDRVNEVHGRFCDTPGAEFSHKLVEEQFKIRLRLDGAEVLERFKEGPFITVSNHPFGAMDGILLLHIVSTYRPDFKVMVNLILNHLSAMRPTFIAVDPSKSSDPAKRRVSMDGIRQAIAHVRAGHPLGFFPAGAVSKINRSLRIRDREWQPSIIRLISQLNVPVIPIYFHGHNTTIFNILGLIDWRIRTLRLPKEVFLTQNKKIHVSVGDPITPERQKECANLEELGRLLRESTYKLEKRKWQEPR